VGKRLSASEETELLRATVREAHETAQVLLAAIREARSLAPNLTADFEAHCHREMQQLSDHLNAEGNRIAADMNASIGEARQEITKQLTAAELVLDPGSNRATLVFNGGRFDDQVPPPRTYLHSKETD
jgi:F0F1-type ATP synthase membrane subunit b/b'